MSKLIISKKVEQLLYTIYPSLSNYPKAEKFSLTQSIKNNFFDLLKYLQLANNVKSKRKHYLEVADGHLQTLKILFKLARNRKYISEGFFKNTDLSLTEINKMLVGYIKST